MALFRSRTNLLAGTVNVNLLNGSKFEFLGRPSVINLWATQDGTGTSQLDVTLGNVVVGEDLPPNTVTVAGDIRRDTDGIGSGVGDAGDRIQIRARNLSTVNPVNVSILVEINEL